MNKKKKKQNGFTIVELVIVIAVIGILAAVLIPTFSNLVKKSKESADQQLVYHINVAAAANEVENGKAPTMYDTLQALENEYGFTIEKMTPRSGCDIVWDSVTNRFALVENGTTIKYGDPNKPSDMANKAQMWRITKKGESLTDGYSHYLTADWTGEDPITVNTGLDVGENYDITSVTYDNSSDASAVVRTNGGTLTVVAPNGTVKHYGDADKVDVQAVANASYHENGVVKLIAVKKGHVELEGKAEVNGIYVYNDSTATEKDTSFEDIKITVNKGVDVPKFSRSAVEVQPEGTKVCTVVTDQAKDIYLFNEGIYEQIKTVDAGKNVASDTSATWADNSAKNTENTQTAAMQLANEFNGTYENGKIADQEVVVTGDNAGTYTVKFNEDTREFETYLGEDKVTTEAIVEAVAEVADVASDSGKTADEAAKASALKGTGTEADPFMVYDYETMQMISDFATKGFRYFAVDIEKTNNGVINCQENGLNWVEVQLNGNFDGKGVKFINLDNYLFTCAWFDNCPESVLIENFSVSCNIRKNSFAAAIVDDACPDLTLKNIKVSGYIQGSNGVASFVGFGSTYGSTVAQKFTFINCESSADIVSTAQEGAGFIAHPYQGTSNNNEIYIIDSKFTGSISYAGTYAHYVAVNASNNSTVYMKYSNGYDVTGLFQNDKTYSLSDTPDENGYLIYGTKNTQGAYCYAKYTNPGMSTKINIKNGTLPEKGNVFSTEANGNAVKATAIFIVGPNGNGTTTIGGNYTGAYMTEELEIVDNNFSTSSIKYFDITINGNATQQTGISGNTFNIVNSHYGTTYGSSMVTIIQYNAQGGIVAITTWNLGASA